VWGIAGCDYGRDELAVNAKLRLPWSGLNPVITNTLLLSSFTFSFTSNSPIFLFLQILSLKV